MLNFRNTRDTWVKCPHQLFEKPGFQKQILGCNKYAKSNHNLYFISENMQEMDIVYSTDRYTLIEQSVNHKSTLIEQSLHCCFVAEFRPPSPRTHFQMTTNIITNWSGLIVYLEEYVFPFSFISSKLGYTVLSLSKNMLDKSTETKSFAASTIHTESY